MAKNLNVFDKEYGLLINGARTKPPNLPALRWYRPTDGRLKSRCAIQTEC